MTQSLYNKITPLLLYDRTRLYILSRRQIGHHYLIAKCIRITGERPTSRVARSRRIFSFITQHRVRALPLYVYTPARNFGSLNRVNPIIHAPLGYAAIDSITRRHQTETKQKRKKNLYILYASFLFPAEYSTAPRSLRHGFFRERPRNTTPPRP